MCGIIGSRGPKAVLVTERFPRMLREISHRGPDGEDVWVSPDRMCALGHKRLAIIDPDGGNQPLSNEDKTIWITFNGCIYNYQDIANFLKQKGHHFKTHCDTEVIVHAYEEWGTRCVEHFNGMWAFAIWDENEKTLFCSRDRVGIKPFYYTWDGKTFTFASEIKALLVSGTVAAQPDQDGLNQYLTFQFCLDDTTLFKDVKRLSPGNNIILKQGRAPRVSCYWEVIFQVDSLHDENYFVDKLEWLLEDAVRLRLRADVPLGSHLSGGLDSSAIVCLSRLLLGDVPIKTFTGAFCEGKEFDETHYAKIVSKAAKTEYLETYLTPDNFVQSIRKIIWHMDEPAAGPGIFPQYWVSKFASEHVKVVLGGQGGDELFIGYARYLVAYLEECLKGAINDTAYRANYVATLETIVPSLSSLENYIPMLKSFWKEGLFEEPTRRYFRLMNRFPESQELFSSDFNVNQEAVFEKFSNIFNKQPSAAMINRILNFDIKTHLQALLHVEDRTSMAWGLESRVPLVDYRIIEMIASVPPTIKFKRGNLKHLFKKVIKNLVPPDILNRKDKMGFPVPLTQWFKNELRDFTADILLSKRCRERNIFNSREIEKRILSEHTFGRSMWGALCLELWYEQFIDSSGTDENNL